jgi:hypothetical protein
MALRIVPGGLEGRPPVRHFSGHLDIRDMETHARPGHPSGYSRRQLLAANAAIAASRVGS